MEFHSGFIVQLLINIIICKFVNWRLQVEESAFIDKSEEYFKNLLKIV